MSSESLIVIVRNQVVRYTPCIFHTFLTAHFNYSHLIDPKTRNIAFEMKGSSQGYMILETCLHFPFHMVK